MTSIFESQPPKIRPPTKTRVIWIYIYIIYPIYIYPITDAALLASLPALRARNLLLKRSASDVSGRWWNGNGVENKEETNHN